MLKKCTVVMLPTKEKADIVLHKDKNISEYVKSQKSVTGESVYFHCQHLYILSDEGKNNNGYVIPNNYPEVWEFRTKPCPLPYWGNPDTCKKIIASTDKNLGLPFPSESFIIKYIESYNTGKPIVDVLVEYEDVGGEEWRGDNFEGEPYWNEILKLKVNSKDNTITIKKVKDSWSREELDNILNDVMNLGMRVRQDQLSGFSSDKSGNEILEEWKLANL
jgi:hypothetical protein